MSETLSSLSVHHLAVVVRDLERAEAFYAGVLGLPVVRRWTDEAGAPRSVWLGLGGGAFLAVERAAAAGPTRSDEAPGWHCVALGIAPSEREAWRRRLTAGGVAVERESAYTMYARDPEGNLVAFSHYPQVPQVPQVGAG
ncbi:VOC family protein [Sorangium sp. So ce362]|uniref:VOC family protein n=1 Tax=Sorangium sp. So ce362 TaxID=3133303 RepID=UPI003F5EF9F3